jgi:hypothetical protein
MRIGLVSSHVVRNLVLSNNSMTAHRGCGLNCLVQLMIAITSGYLDPWSAPQQGIIRATNIYRLDYRVCLDVCTIESRLLNKYPLPICAFPCISTLAAIVRGEDPPLSNPAGCPQCLRTNICVLSVCMPTIAVMIPPER